MSLETKLFELINNNEYAAGLPLLEHVDINALDEDGCSLLMAAIENHSGAPAERYTFIERVLSHPEFRHANKPVDGTIAPPFQALINQADLHAVNLLIKYKDQKTIQVIFHKEQLLYEKHAAYIQIIRQDITQDPSSVFCETIEDEEKILATLLQVAVEYAIKTDDPSILQRLVDAGAQLHLPLKDGVSPIDLAPDTKDSKVHEWLTRHIREYLAANPVYLLAARNITREHRERAQAIVQAHTAETSDKIRSLFKFYDYKPEQPSSEKQDPMAGNTPKS